MFPHLPFAPIRSSLYTTAELMSGLNPGDYLSFGRTPDFKCFEYFVAQGKAAPRDALTSMMEALHDNSITQATLALLKRKSRVAAIMGGHDEPRDSAAYASVAHIARALARKGFLLASGGGPGAMEATHLGAFLSKQPEENLTEAVKQLARKCPNLPSNASHVIKRDGSLDKDVLRQLHAWLTPAYSFSQTIEHPGESLAVPTWYYGQEPTSPFATHIAKYFQNSLREDGLITLAAHGIVFASGKAGTLQEIFQDSVRNYYRLPNDPFSPMVFWGKRYWTRTLPVVKVLEALFTKNDRAKDYQQYVLITDDEAEAVDFLFTKAPPAKAHVVRLEALGMLKKGNP